MTEGVTPVIRKHNVSQSLFHKWKKQFDLNGLAGLNDNYKRIDPEKRSLETEIKQLRQLVGKWNSKMNYYKKSLSKPLKMSICRQFSHRTSVSNVIQWAEVSNSDYYYRHKANRPGSTLTMYKLKV